ncbi:MAG: lysophospholipase [Burkholderiaceae bacterium]|jgi:alpha-beta hydrolase superfamily lysophospholipase
MNSPLEQTGTLLTRDGTRLFYREWLAEPARAALHIVHGLGEHSGRYAHVARRLNKHGVSVRAHDHRGHGRSHGARGALNSGSDLTADLKLVFDDFARQQRTTPFLLGHSLGGLVAADFATARLSPIRGLILSSPALALAMSPGQKLLLAATGTLAPRLAVSNGLDISAISHDAAVVAAYRADPLNHAKVTPRLVNYMLEAIASVQRNAMHLSIPVLLLVAGADRLVPPEGSRQFFEALPSGGGTLRWYDDSYHEVFNESADRRARALEDLTVWLDQHMAG